MPAKIEPFQICQIDETRFFVNGGNVYNYYNPYRRVAVRYNRDETFLKKIHEGEIPDNSHVFEIQSTDKLVFVNVVCQFSPPKYFPGGFWFIPKIERSWIQLVKIDENDNVSRIGETNCSNDENVIKMDGDFATNICCVGTIQFLPNRKNENRITIEQLWHKDIMFTEWQSIADYTNYNLPDLQDITIISSTLQKPHYRKGYCLKAYETVSNTFVR